MNKYVFVSFCVALIVLGASHRLIETKMIETFATQNPEYIAIDPPQSYTIKDVQDNEVICTNVFYTRDGYPFLWPDTEVGINCDQNIWKSNSKWYMRLMTLPDTFSITGYRSLPHNAEPVYIVP